jgi:uncharacterized membrane protein
MRSSNQPCKELVALVLRPLHEAQSLAVDVALRHLRVGDPHAMAHELVRERARGPVEDERVVRVLEDAPVALRPNLVEVALGVRVARALRPEREVAELPGNLADLRARLVVNLVVVEILLEVELFVEALDEAAEPFEVELRPNDERHARLREIGRARRRLLRLGVHADRRKRRLEADAARAAHRCKELLGIGGHEIPFGREIARYRCMQPT